MRLPRVRFTIGRLMVASFLASVALWIVLVAHPQLIAERQALASYRQAALVREVAESAVREYTEGIYKRDKATYQGQIALARSDLGRAMDRLESSKKGKSKGFLALMNPVADELTKQQAEFDLEQARTQLRMLEEYTKQKQIKSLRSDVAKARAGELATFTAYRMERSRRWWWVPGL